MRRSVIAAAAAGLILMFSGAGGIDGGWAAEKPVTPAKPPAAAVKKPGKTEAVAKAPVPEYRYSTAGKSDPFRPFMETDPAVVKKREEEAKRRKAALMKASVSPLQQAELDVFRLVGIIGDATNRTAMVVDGVTKKFYPLTIGTYIGANGGRVKAIERDRVVVAEPTETEGKGKRIRLVTMKLYKEEGRP